MAEIMQMRWLGDNAVDVAGLLPDHNFHHKDGVLIIHQHGGDVRIPKGWRFAVDDTGHAHKVLMLTRQFTLKPNSTVTACPRCGNNTAFTACSVQVVEDCCEVFIICRCSFDPTGQNTDYRFEDVMGYLNEDNIMVALRCWNCALAEEAITP
ncbi:hypothetical protein U876_23700 [Aeromonas hydrophila NJ-35]|uniref:hypothetical protein n=1 Tax=Aeromonas TaxID=642 RepID=UPI000640B010|nr:MULTISPECIES: hypothetical protein [Aeromonas]AKJ37109.1 hypothetical protein U876_23700 [Aeromonas hydrophila NJ-35]ALZ82557.1 hypothetical protein AhyD4_23395 [Aeromonas hydrophila]HDK8695622.1 hypothetical protein [Aeromonas hydrophila]